MRSAWAMSQATRQKAAPGFRHGALGFLAGIMGQDGIALAESG